MKDEGLHVLAVNSGSSSLKLGLYRVHGDDAQALWTDTQGGLAGLAPRLAAAGLPAPQAVGHRIVHGGPQLRDAGVQRYGFHGLSCESIVHQLAGALPQRLLIAHLGNGASISAVRDGISIDTSMGMTPTGGIVMGTRSGDLDPGTLVWLMREMKLDADALEDLVERRSGLAGISGLSGDMRTLHEAACSNADARLAIEMFCRSAARQIAAMCTVLGGIDRLVFTGGIGENDAAVRHAICERLACIGLSASQVRVLPSQEDEQIARHAWTLLAAQRRGPISPPAQ